jgi:hypothetical protein
VTTFNKIVAEGDSTINGIPHAKIEIAIIAEVIGSHLCGTG